MFPDYPLHRGETDAEPFALFRAGEALEGGKQLVRVCLVESNTVVPDEIGRHPADISYTEFDDPLLPSGGVLPGVAERLSNTARSRFGSQFATTASATRKSTRRSGSASCSDLHVS